MAKRIAAADLLKIIEKLLKFMESMDDYALGRSLIAGALEKDYSMVMIDTSEDVNVDHSDNLVINNILSEELTEIVDYANKMLKLDKKRK